MNGSRCSSFNLIKDIDIYSIDKRCPYKYTKTDGPNPTFKRDFDPTEALKRHVAAGKVFSVRFIGVSEEKKIDKRPVGPMKSPPAKRKCLENGISSKSSTISDKMTAATGKSAGSSRDGEKKTKNGTTKSPTTPENGTDARKKLRPRINDRDAPFTNVFIESPPVSESNSISRESSPIEDLSGRSSNEARKTKNGRKASPMDEKKANGIEKKNGKSTDQAKKETNGLNRRPSVVEKQANGHSSDERRKTRNGHKSPPETEKKTNGIVKKSNGVEKKSNGNEKLDQNKNEATRKTRNGFHESPAVPEKKSKGSERLAQLAIGEERKTRNGHKPSPAVPEKRCKGSERLAQLAADEERKTRNGHKSSPAVSEKRSNGSERLAQLALDEERKSRKSSTASMEKEKLSRKNSDEDRKMKRPDISEDDADWFRVFPIVDRHTSTTWYGSEDMLRKWRSEVESEQLFHDYFPQMKQQFEQFLTMKPPKDKKSIDENNISKHFWNEEMHKLNRAVEEHPSMRDSFLWLNRKRWTEAQVKIVLRFILAKGLCEHCHNPFRLKESIIDKIPCICPRPLKPIWNSIRLSPAEASSEMADLAYEVLWDRECERYRRIHEGGLRTMMIEEFGYQQFHRLYPLNRIPLSKRTDEFGKAVFAKQEELHDLHRSLRIAPIYIVAWTDKKTGDIGMPQEWIADGPCKLSDETKEYLEKYAKSFDFLKCSCKDGCSSSHRCCWSKSKDSDWLVKNGTLQMSHGLRPCGVDGFDVIRAPHEVNNVKMTVCGARCGCAKDECPLRFIDRGSSSKMKMIVMTDNRGWSVRTAEILVRGEYVMSFSGQVRTQTEAEQTRQDMDMAFDLALPTRTNGNNKVLMITTDDYCNSFKYINHSCNPNSMICTVFNGDYGEYLHGVSLFTRKTLRAYKEILYDYYKPGDRFRFDCMCGGYACRGMRGEDIK